MPSDGMTAPACGKLRKSDDGPGSENGRGLGRLKAGHPTPRTRRAPAEGLE